jgi:opacity protein-like surface antigen
MRRMAWLGLVAGSTCGLACADAADSGFYAAVDAGVTEASVGRSEGVFFATPFIIFRKRPDTTTSDDGLSGSATIGYRINRHVAAELGYLDFRTVDITETYDLTDVFGAPFPVIHTIELGSSTAGPALSLLGFVPLTGQVAVFGRAGMFFADQEVERSDFGVSDTFGHEIWLAGLGVDWSLDPSWSVRLEYQRADELKGNDRTGPIRLERLVAGVSYRF